MGRFELHLVSGQGVRLDQAGRVEMLQSVCFHDRGNLMTHAKLIFPHWLFTVGSVSVNTRFIFWLEIWWWISLSFRQVRFHF